MFYISAPQHFWHQELVLRETVFQRTGLVGVASGRLKGIACIMHFISVIVTSAPTQIIRH